MAEQQKQEYTSISDQTVLWPEGWIQVKVPVPFSLRWVNSYLVPEQEGYTLIDPGLGTEEAIAVWDAALQKHHIQWTDITRILLTHQHPDHYGLAGYVQERSRAPVFISRASHAYTVRLWGENSEFADQLLSLYAEHGMPGEQREAIAHNLGSFKAMVSPQPKVTYMEAGSRISLGGKSWLLIDAPGHANGQLCFYEQENGWMICGDQVLPHITPNVSIIPGEDGDPLAAFLHSLEELKQYEVKLAFPGHRDPFSEFTIRIAEIQQHHERRLNRMTAWLKEEPRTAYAMCETLFGSRLSGNAHNLRFAMSETLAHLYYLELRGRIASNVHNGVYVYAAVTS
ncbi:glyoxylase-like metal-dependent hydrolase (beta-lactamase superfamily II) [Paenibacillus castaneae]|uniref:MBL fold metallo-hydrolase n=1 Tax=Paenibacillus castaneae TaxID=474957 RepID=UPI000C9BE11A|nr:MBL fold metallo-hydrolase [Paenibacillus castaneae]NIK76016.1 glyoxylase-like metal-dependent hydrolase (beta-lactamase superfamily II) [Paenibacillus castaneae]